MKGMNQNLDTANNGQKPLNISVLQKSPPPFVKYFDSIRNFFVSHSGRTSSALSGSVMPEKNKERAERRRQKRMDFKRLYGNSDEDFQLGETVSGHVVGFHSTKKKNLQYVFVDTDDGRHTRVHVRSFDISGNGNLQPENLRKGDPITLRKTGYNPDRHTTYWHVEAAPFAALINKERFIDKKGGCPAP